MLRIGKHNFLDTLPDIDSEDNCKIYDTLNTIERYVDANPKSRSRAAWDLVNKHYDTLVGNIMLPDANSANSSGSTITVAADQDKLDVELVKDLYIHSFKHSGWFSWSKATVALEDVSKRNTFFFSASLESDLNAGRALLYVDEKGDNREAKICQALRKIR